MAETEVKSINGRPVADVTARAKIEEIKNAAPGLVFDTAADMEAYIAGNASALKVGQDLFIRESDVPDYWWDGTTAVPVETELGEVKEQLSKLSEAIADKATLENGVIKFWKSAETEGGADTELFTVDISTVGGSGGLDLNNLTLSVSQVGEYQRLSMSDGTTTKTVDIPITAISDEQVQTAVQAWLDEHPEATTTVADGSITIEKLDEGVATEITSLNKKLHFATYWGEPFTPGTTIPIRGQEYQSLSGRINVFENVQKGIFEITSDISDKTIIVHGVNYFDANDLIYGTVGSSNGVISASTTNMYNKKLIPVQPEKKLYWNRTKLSSVSYMNVHYYDENQNWVRRQAIGHATYCGRITPNNGEYFIRLCLERYSADEQIQIADVDVGNTQSLVDHGYDNSAIEGTNFKTYFGKTVFFPYIGYRIENGKLIGAGDTYTLEEVMHIDAFEATSEVSATVPIEPTGVSDEERQDGIDSISVEYGRANNSSYYLVRIPKYTNDGRRMTPKVAITSKDGSVDGSKVSALTFAKRENVPFVINAGLFNTQTTQPQGQTIINGISITNTPMTDDMGTAISDAECYPLCIDINGDLSSPYDRSVDTADMIADGVIYAVTAWGQFIDNYSKVDETKYNEIVHPGKYIRQSIGQYQNGDYFVCSVDGVNGVVANESGMTYDELADLLISKGVKYAYSLDGGGSCETVLGDRQLNIIFEAGVGRAVPTVIYFDVIDN